MSNRQSSPDKKQNGLRFPLSANVYVISRKTYDQYGKKRSQNSLIYKLQVILGGSEVDGLQTY